MSPVLSIIIPLYNKEKHIIDTLDSVWSQSFSNFEIIIVNDGSTDNSLNKINAINDERLRIFSIENQGVSYARNYGVSKANTNLIVFLDADDIWLKHHLQDLKELQEEFPDCGMYCKAYDKKNEHILIPSKFKNIPNDSDWKGIIKDYFQSSLMNSIAWTSAVMVPKQTFDEIGKFNTTYDSGEDTDLWIRIALKFPVAFSNKVSAIHNLNSDHKITNQKLSSRQHLDFNTFLVAEKQNRSLKTYLDLNRYAVAIEYKLEGNSVQSKSTFQDIDSKNLTTLQKLIFNLPTLVIQQVLKFRNILRRLHLDLRLFR
ncbi:glycosyltransferase family 2 protein [Psychroserpens sp.]|uniref:glycosyltransferase family 2 protein n=1 Tax=Psychroserpens sp. TaxID=2020870 RepID=UPI0038590F8C